MPSGRPCHTEDPKFVSIPVAEAVDELLSIKEKSGKSAVHIKDLKLRLWKFEQAMDKVTFLDMETWLFSIKAGAGSQENYLTAVRSLFKLGVKRGWCAPLKFSDIEITKQAESAQDEDDEQVEVFTPDELVTLMSHARPEMVPFLAIGAFTGLRYSEISRLDWRKFLWETGYIDLRTWKTKTRQPRLVPILPVLRTWLQP